MSPLVTLGLVLGGAKTLARPPRWSLQLFWHKLWGNEGSDTGRCILSQKRLPRGQAGGAASVSSKQRCGFEGARG